MSGWEQALSKLAVGLVEGLVESGIVSQQRRAEAEMLALEKLRALKVPEALGKAYAAAKRKG